MEKIAKIVSIVFHPIFITLYCAIVFYITTDTLRSYASWGNIVFFCLIVVFTIILPSLLIWIRYKQGKISDIRLSKRSERTAVYLQAITLSMICAYLLFILLHVYTFVYFWVFAIFALASLAVVNMWWKISIHSCGMGILCGFMVFLSLFYNVPAIFWLSSAIILSGLVMTSRCLLQAHTLGQTVAGFFVGLGFTLLPNLTFFITK